MKITNKRRVGRCMSFFRNNYGFRVPYQVLVDGTFCLAALEGQVRVSEQLEKYFQCDLKILTTQCVILEMEKIGSPISGAIKICKQFAVHKCGHDKKAIAASKCLESMISPSNSNRYIIATQDPFLKKIARSTPGTPVLYLHSRSPTLEKPSHESTEQVLKLQIRCEGQDHALERLRHLKKEELGDPVCDEKLLKKKKKWKFIKPIKNVQKSLDNVNEVLVNKPQSSKKRIRIRIAKHVKEELFSREK